jgi:hypothetical protein
MAYLHSTGSREMGDIEFEGDPDETQIDFEDDFIALKTGGNQVLVVSGSFVGIGTNDPDNTLHVLSAGTTHIKVESEAGYLAALRIKAGGQTSAYVWVPADTADLRFYVNGADRMHLDNDGKVGIGTTTPDELLTLNAAEPNIQFQEGESDRAKIGINDSDNVVIHQQTSNKHIVFKVNDGGVTREGMRINGAVPEVVVNEGSDSLVDFRVESNNSTHMLFVDGGSDTVGVGTSSPGSALHVNASFATAISGKTSDYTLTGGDHTILVDCSSGNVTLTLPTAVGCAGRMYVIKRIDATNNAANINSAGSEEIEGSTSPASVAALGSLSLQSDNSGWWKMAEYVNPP